MFNSDVINIILSYLCDKDNVVKLIKYNKKNANVMKYCNNRNDNCIRTTYNKLYQTTDYYSIEQGEIIAESRSFIVAYVVFINLGHRPSNMITSIFDNVMYLFYDQSKSCCLNTPVVDILSNINCIEISYKFVNIQKLIEYHITETQWDKIFHNNAWLLDKIVYANFRYTPLSKITNKLFQEKWMEHNSKQVLIDIFKSIAKKQPLFHLYIAPSVTVSKMDILVSIENLSDTRLEEMLTQNNNNISIYSFEDKENYLHKLILALLNPECFVSYFCSKINEVCTTTELINKITTLIEYDREITTLFSEQ